MFTQTRVNRAARVALCALRAEFRSLDAVPYTVAHDAVWEALDECGSTDHLDDQDRNAVDDMISEALETLL